MAYWILRHFYYIHFEVWIVIIVNYLVATTLLILIAFILKKTDCSKQSVFYASIAGGLLGLMWLVATGQFLLFLAKDINAGVGQGNWIFILRFAGGSRELFGHASSTIFKVISYFYFATPNFLQLNPFVWALTPSYIFVFFSSTLGSFMIAIALLELRNGIKVLSKIMLLGFGFMIIFISFYFSVVYQAYPLAFA